MNEGEKLEEIGHAMMLAWGRIKKAQARMWGDWMTIGEGLLEGRRWAMKQAGTNRPEGKGYVMAFGEWLRRYKVDDMDKADRAKLLQLMEERPGVEEWRATLTDYERRNLNNPTIAWRKWTAATRVKKLRSAGGVATTPYVEELQARIEELQQELGAARAGSAAPAATEDKDRKIADLKAHIALLHARPRSSFFTVKIATGLAVIVPGPDDWNIFWVTGGERVAEAVGPIATYKEAEAIAAAGSAAAYYGEQAEAESELETEPEPEAEPTQNERVDLQWYGNDAFSAAAPAGDGWEFYVKDLRRQVARDGVATRRPRRGEFGNWAVYRQPVGTAEATPEYRINTASTMDEAKAQAQAVHDRRGDPSPVK